jgi:hypothetical protein
MSDPTNGRIPAGVATEQERALSRRTFLTRVMSITGCAAIGLLLDACGTSSTSTAPTSAAAPTAGATAGTPTAAAATVAAPTAEAPTVGAEPTATAATAAPAQGNAPPAGGPGGPPGGNETEALAEAFKGVTTDGNLIAGLYPIHSSGVATDGVRAAAEAFLASLTDDQRAATLFTIDDDEWRKWTNVDGGTRQGTSLKDMTEAQRTAAFAMLGAALSAKGLQTTRDIMKLNTTEGELLSQTDRFNELLYWFTVMGTPSATEPWGFQLDGHHLIINYFVLGDQVVMAAPNFMGAEPPVATTGTYSGVSVLQTEQDKGLAMINALTDDQRKIAIVDANKSGDNLQAGAYSDNAVLAYVGIKADALTADQQTQLLALIGEWVGNMDDGHAAVKMQEVKDHIADTYFAWVGAIDAEAVFYYRIQSPVILIEFDHELPGPLGQNPDYASDVPTRRHIHTIVRTPNGNDYSKDLLRQHLAAYHHELTPAGIVHVPVLAAAAAGVAATLLPPRYRNGAAASPAPMPAPPRRWFTTRAARWPGTRSGATTTRSTRSAIWRWPVARRIVARCSNPQQQNRCAPTQPATRE